FASSLSPEPAVFAPFASRHVFAASSLVGSQTGTFHGGAVTKFVSFVASSVSPCGADCGQPGCAAASVKIALPLALKPVTRNTSTTTGSLVFPGTVNDTRMSPTTRWNVIVKDAPALAVRESKLSGLFLSNSKPQKWSPSLSPT